MVETKKNRIYLRWFLQTQYLIISLKENSANIIRKLIFQAFVKMYSIDPFLISSTKDLRWRQVKDYHVPS